MNRTCSFEGCERSAPYRGPLCTSHHRQQVAGEELHPIQLRRKMVPQDGSPCEFPGCHDPRGTGALCSGHYGQLMRGEDLHEKVSTPGRSERRFWERVDKVEGGCWTWRGKPLNSGYASCKINGKSWLIHRYSFTVHHHEIPAGDEVDHLCRNKLCVNPEHLRAVSHVVNVRAQGLRSNNTSGVRGVYWDSSRERWTATVRRDGRKVHLGRFATLDEAAAAVRAARDAAYLRGE